MNNNMPNSNINVSNDISTIQDGETIAPSTIPANKSENQLLTENEQNKKSNIKLDATNKTPDNETKKTKKTSFITVLLLLIIAGLCFYLYYNYSLHQKEIAHLKEECTPVSTAGETKKLDLNSTIVQDLYAKVKTNIREDIANFELNDEMKLYLAYRQLPTSKIYDSNCNYFNDTKMPPYICKETLEFTPTAFKQEDLTIELEKLFGENINIVHEDIQLGFSCLGGYQYIADRGEYVKGECTQLTTTTFRADKELINATSTESTIVLYEKVKYYGAEGKNPPEKLISGTYKYTFRLDRNYNYIYINKELEG